MHNFFSKTAFFLLLILCLGFFLRHDNYRTVPRHGATFDEFAWTWLGINLIQKQTPISWSSQPQYHTRYHLVYQGAAFWIVQPYLEHPPLFGLIAGGFSLVNHTKNMMDVSLAKTRPLALILGVCAILAVFFFVRELYGDNLGLFAAFIYEIMPTVVIGSRLIQNENFFIPVWLASLYLLIRYLRTKKTAFLVFSIFLAGLLSLAKVPWLIAGFSLVMILSYKKLWKQALAAGIGTLFIFSLFLIYGFLLNREVFMGLWSLQLARYDIHFLGFFSIFVNPLLVDRYYLDGWIFFGWFSIVLLSKNFKQHAFVLIPFLCYFVLYIFAIPNEPAHGWYRYPFYPFLAIAIAIVLAEEFRRQTLFFLFFLFIVGLALFGNTWEHVFGFSYLVYRIFILAVCGSVLPLLWFSHFRKYGKPLFILWFVVYSMLSIFSIMYFVDL